MRAEFTKIIFLEDFEINLNNIKVVLCIQETCLNDCNTCISLLHYHYTIVFDKVFISLQILIFSCILT